MSGGIAGRGRPGPAGPQGPLGPQGPQGDPAFTLAIGEVTAVPYGDAPSVQNVGTNQDQIWDLALPTGATGVLTGSDPPSGTDGTSLGQLYFCTTNQTYYGLIELSENNNKWRPIMTQESNIRRYELDLVSVRTGDTQPGEAGGGKIAGHAAVMLDDVAQKASMAIFMVTQVPAAPSPTWRDHVDLYVCLETQKQLKSDLALRGITSLPFTVAITVNGVETSATLNLIADDAPDSFLDLDRVIHPVPGSGTEPGQRSVWIDGRLSTQVNETGAPGASTYGDAPAAAVAPATNKCGRITYLNPDTQYISSVVGQATVVIPYA